MTQGELYDRLEFALNELKQRSYRQEVMYLINNFGNLEKDYINERLDLIIEDTGILNR